MAKTFTFTANNVSKTPITCQLNGAVEVEIGEDPSVTGYPTQGFQIFAPGSGDAAVQIQPGGRFVFRAGGMYPFGVAMFSQGQVLGYLSTLLSAITIGQVERG